ncbi:cytochrome ubiquinol oxidase subunit I [Peredibacter sp. HCB2-198]|uniref:cytochrome ubiquinol oxidase subunit I n=1 Tax=Peredibacter sp. HCB2-198 TaxID=3383025 RepID=UPI0038B6A9CA
MDSLLAARLQMAFSLGFHIIFACIGMVMPFLMSASYWHHLKKSDPESLELTKLWMKGVAIFFAVGAVSGTLLSFELGLLWPEFMKHAGPIVGMPFSWEGTAFFLEAIALGIFLYGFGRLSPWKHWFSSLIVGISGVLSGIFVVAVNAWMNAPQGFTQVNGTFKDIDPWKAMFNPAWFSQAHHMTIASFSSVSAAVLAVHSLLYLMGRRKKMNLLAIKITAPFFIVAALLQPLSGDFAAKDVAKRQPLKLAAMESLFHTTTHAPLLLGGIPNQERQTIQYGIELPSLLSVLAFGDPGAKVQGLNDFPKENWPPVLIVHGAFQIMVACGSAMALTALLALFIYFKKKTFTETPWLLVLFVLIGPLGFIAIEAGWTVTEVGRQPWIIYGIMKTRDAVSNAPALQLTFFTYLFLYLFLSGVITWLFYRLILVHFLKKDEHD